tara:strand:- start:31 stop:222 length:192 start_codon:yes stop_codon:yes gene_type:complete
MSTRVLYEYQKQLKLLYQQLLDAFTQGVESFEEYKYIQGKLHMLNICQQELSRLLDEEEKIDD